MKLFGIVAIVFFCSLPAFSQGTITGRVTYGENLPLHDASVSIVQTQQVARTDRQGNFELASVPAGRHTLLVHQEGFSDSTRIVTVTSGSTVTADFRLEIQALREEVTVTASGTEQSVFDSIQSVTSVGSTQILERASTGLGDVLEGQPGVAKRSFGPGSSRPVIRGFDGDRVLVLQDGVRTGSIGSQSGDHGEPVDPLSAERIEVVKGPATLLYGSNAIGGVVNVIGNDENEPHEGARGFANVVGSTADRQAGFATGLEYGLGKVLLRGNFGVQRTGDFETPLGRIPNSASRTNSGSFGAGYYGDKAYFSGSFSTDIRRYGIPFAALFEDHGEEEDERPSGGVLPEVDEDIDIRMRNHKLRFNGGFRGWTGGLLSGLQYNVDYSDYRHKEIETADGVDEIGTIFDNKTFSYRTLFEQQKYGRLTGRFGFEGYSRNYEVNGAEQLITGEVKHNSFSAFGLEELNFDRVKLQFGGRVESNRYNPEDPLLRDRSFTAFSGGAGVNIGLWEGGAFVANFTHSNRAPALEELYNNGPHIGTITFEVGNNDLVRETSNGIDLSLRHLSNKFRFTGDVYHYRINNYVFLAPQDENNDGVVDVEDGLPVGRYEQADAAYTGVELNAEVRLTDNIGAFAGFDYVRAKLVDGSINLPRIPPARGRVGLDLRYGGLNVRPEAVLAADQDKIFPLEVRTPGYATFNVAGSYTIGRQHHAHIFSVNAYNLTDKLYRNHVSFIKELVPEIGRGVRFGYTVRFF